LNLGESEDKNEFRKKTRMRSDIEKVSKLIFIFKLDVQPEEEEFSNGSWPQFEHEMSQLSEILLWLS